MTPKYETLQRHVNLAYELMTGLRHDQKSQGYILAAKAWMSLEQELRKLARSEKNISSEPDQPALPITTETPSTEPEQLGAVVDRVLKRVAAK